MSAPPLDGQSSRSSERSERLSHGPRAADYTYRHDSTRRYRNRRRRLRQQYTAQARDFEARLQGTVERQDKSWCERKEQRALVASAGCTVLCIAPTKLWITASDRESATGSSIAQSWPVHNPTASGPVASQEGLTRKRPSPTSAEYERTAIAKSGPTSTARKVAASSINDAFARFTAAVASDSSSEGTDESSEDDDDDDDDDLDLSEQNAKSVGQFAAPVLHLERQVTSARSLPRPDEIHGHGQNIRSTKLRPGSPTGTESNSDAATSGKSGREDEPIHDTSKTALAMSEEDDSSDEETDTDEDINRTPIPALTQHNDQGASPTTVDAIKTDAQSTAKSDFEGGSTETDASARSQDVNGREQAEDPAVQYNDADHGEESQDDNESLATSTAVAVAPVHSTFDVDKKADAEQISPDEEHTKRSINEALDVEEIEHAQPDATAGASNASSTSQADTDAANDTGVPQTPQRSQQSCLGAYDQQDRVSKDKATSHASSLETQQILHPPRSIARMQEHGEREVLRDVKDIWEEVSTITRATSPWSLDNEVLDITHPRALNFSAIICNMASETITNGRPPLKRKRTPGVSSALFPPVAETKFGLLQEKLWQEPFWLLIATTFLNKTAGRVAAPIFWQLKEKYETPQALAEAEEDELTEMIWTLGLQRQRAQRMLKMARAWATDEPVAGKRYRTMHYPARGDGKQWKNAELIEGDDEESKGALEIGHIPGCGAYAFDSWRIFCRDIMRGVATDYNGLGADKGFEPEWKRVLPDDKELRPYLRWMWLREGWIWDAETGLKRRTTDEEWAAAVKGQIEPADEVEQEITAEVRQEPKRRLRSSLKPE